MKKKSSLFKTEDGAALAVVSLSMAVLLSISAIVIDGGALYLEKSRVQKAVDAATLAGAQVLPATERAREIAIDIASENGITIDNENILITDTSIEVSAQAEKELTFARIMGFSSTNVSARARAEKGGTVVGGSGFLPLVVVEDAFKQGQLVELTSPPGNGATGNYGYIRFDEGTLAYNITHGYKGHLEKRNANIY
ncbi:MAG: pilus assembly protein TadG-related protein [Bacillus sp. (in: Bacteria)]|nr:pilus assembly protein TadG-related protein [Bacillus sp. (in: firmicutes)]